MTKQIKLNQLNEALKISADVRSALIVVIRNESCPMPLQVLLEEANERSKALSTLLVKLFTYETLAVENETN